jgi:hypothetical protein
MVEMETNLGTKLISWGNNLFKNCGVCAFFEVKESLFLMNFALKPENRGKKLSSKFLSDALFKYASSKNIIAKTSEKKMERILEKNLFVLL